MEKLLFAWDFHGVLEKDNDLAVQEVCNTILSENQIVKKITLQEVRNLYGKRWYEYWQYLLPQASSPQIEFFVQRSVES